MLPTLIALVAMSARPAIMSAILMDVQHKQAPLCSMLKRCYLLICTHVSTLPYLCMQRKSNATRYCLAGFAGNERLRIGRQRSGVLHLDWLLCAQPRLHAAAHGPA